MPIVLNGATSGSTTVQATDAVTATLTLPSSTGTLVSTTSPASGNVIQVVSTTKTDTFTTTSSSYGDVTGLTLSITPKFSNSKILLVASVNASVSNNNAIGVAIKFAGGNTANYVGNAAGSRNQAAVGMKMESTNFNYYFVPMPFNMDYLDSPATTSPITYSVQLKRTGTAGTIYVNQSGEDADNTFHIRTASTITALEIAA